MKKFMLFCLVALVYLLHQDNWNWTNGGLVFGLLPVGLAYHVGYSFLAAGTMAILVRFAWPKHLENAEEQPPFDREKSE